MTLSCPIWLSLTVMGWVCKYCSWICDPRMNCFFFCSDKEENDKRYCWCKMQRWRGAGDRTILILPFLTFIMLKGHNEHPVSSSPAFLWRAQTLHNLVAPRYHHSSHYLAKPIPFDLCNWCTLFTIGRAHTSTEALLKEMQEQNSMSDWMVERKREMERRREREKSSQNQTPETLRQQV